LVSTQGFRSAAEKEYKTRHTGVNRRVCRVDNSFLFSPPPKKKLVLIHIRRSPLRRKNITFGKFERYSPEIEFMKEKKYSYGFNKVE
jgi:hypothetical protein